MSRMVRGDREGSGLARFDEESAIAVVAGAGGKHV
jgi:hypothetical protein